MHNPKLKARLHRIRIPTLFLWGTADRILSEQYGRAYCAAIPGARFETIERAGHFPHIEQPEEFARRALAFADASRQGLPRTRRASGD
jgi:pimeloyl-ACP methyl ester carboxylesterase